MFAQAIKKNSIKVSLLIIISFFVSSYNAGAQPCGVTSNSWCLLGNTSTGAANFIGTFDNVPLNFRTNNTEWMRIDETGNVGIGTSFPGAKLEVAGQIKITGGAPGTGKVLTSNSLGLASWTDPTLGTITSVSATAPIISSGGTAPVISITQASASTNGFLSSANWNTFNNKVNGSGTLNYIPKWTANGAILGNSSIFDNGYVGIGTTSPQAKLEVKNGCIIFDGVGGGYSAINGSGTRMMWIPAKRAFRAGMVDGAQWNNINIGLFSAAFGRSTTAQSYASFVIGQYNISTGADHSNSWSFPKEPLFVIGNGTNTAAHNALTVLKNGNVGIETPTPTEKLEVNGLIKLPPASNNQNTSPGLVFASNDDFTFVGKRLNHYGIGAYDDNGRKLYMSGFYGLNFFTGGQNRVTVDVNGNVGIGTDLTSSTYNPSYKLAVNGAIRAKRVVVETPWSDFVFETNYKLAPLKEVEQYIKQNGHLPEMPSAKEVETNGGDLGSLVKLQMQKIEELTLYAIEQNKKIEELSAQIKSMKQ